MEGLVGVLEALREAVIWGLGDGMDGLLGWFALWEGRRRAEYEIGSRVLMKWGKRKGEGFSLLMKLISSFSETIFLSFLVFF